MFRSESQGEIQGGMEYSGAHCYFSGREDMVESILEKAEDQGSTISCSTLAFIEEVR